MMATSDAVKDINVLVHIVQKFKRNIFKRLDHILNNVKLSTIKKLFKIKRSKNQIIKIIFHIMKKRDLYNNNLAHF